MNDTRTFFESPTSAELATLLASPAPTTWRGRFYEGAAAPWRGLKFLNRHKSLWRFTVWPLLANVLITGLVLIFLTLMAGWVLSVAHPWFQRRDGLWPAWAGWMLEVVFAAVLLVVCLGAAVVLWKLLTGILCGYFYGMLAKEVETTLGIASGELRDLSLRYQAVDTLYDLTAILATQGGFFLVGLLPLIGAPLAIVGGLSLTWFIFGRDYLDFPLALRGMRRYDKRRFCRERLPHTLGLGSVVFVMQFVPILGALFLTTAVVGAVLLHRRLAANTQ